MLAEAMRALDRAAVLLLVPDRKVDLDAVRSQIRSAQAVLERLSDGASHGQPRLLQQTLRGETEVERLLLNAYMVWAQATARTADVSWEAVVGSSRTRTVVDVRMAIARLLREKGATWVLIGKILGGRNHSTVIQYLRPAKGRT